MGGGSIQGDSREPLHPPLVPFRQVSADTNLSDLMCRPGMAGEGLYVHKVRMVPFPHRFPG
jgi:hypothetical protein